MLTCKVHVSGSRGEGILQLVVREECTPGVASLLVRARELRTDLSGCARDYGVASPLKK
jgi:hypothetical protein